ncbi:hypothetical protein POSPLADRAFT_1050866 [Postia placenta MAD-698-R-SB12]|uniref:Uncharacterized protein n=1 Tax=Postia placenta MAD-698-R-SB12 TaxID=670580 RepID=A0A1X6MIE1_9APHY|nr:hypothetical protein POSPLADRAFT_1050866 [Postia placenta MAD-698-R-SB12]OSX56207.1 hypothetical protein POSPLADRAFT_1050866 [Postia placenta MAD-698-R-SB12]
MTADSASCQSPSPYVDLMLYDAWSYASRINARPPGQAWHYNEVAECAFSLSRTSVRLQAFEMGAKNSLKVKIPAHNSRCQECTSGSVDTALRISRVDSGTVLGERKTITHCTARCAVTKLESVASNNCASKIIHRHSSSMNLRALRPALCPFRTLCHCDRMIDIQIAIGSGSPVRHISRLDDYGTSSALCGQRVENRVYSREGLHSSAMSARISPYGLRR